MAGGFSTRGEEGATPSLEAELNPCPTAFGTGLGGIVQLMDSGCGGDQPCFKNSCDLSMAAFLEGKGSSSVGTGYRGPAASPGVPCRVTAASATLRSRMSPRMFTTSTPSAAKSRRGAWGSCQRGALMSTSVRLPGEESSSQGWEQAGSWGWGFPEWLKQQSSEHRATVVQKTWEGQETSWDVAAVAPGGNITSDWEHEPSLLPGNKL